MFSLPFAGGALPRASVLGVPGRAPAVRAACRRSHDGRITLQEMRMSIRRRRRTAATVRALAMALALALTAVIAAVSDTRLSLRGAERHGASAHEERSVVRPRGERVD